MEKRFKALYYSRLLAVRASNYISASVMVGQSILAADATALLNHCFKQPLNVSGFLAIWRINSHVAPVRVVSRLGK
jgi:hypothetical protein